MRMPRAMRLVHEKGKFFAGEFLVDFCNLRREAIIRARPAVADKTRDLGIGFQHRPDRLDPSLCFLGRAVWS